MAFFSVATFSPGYELSKYSSVATFSHTRIQAENVAVQKLYPYRKTPPKLWPSIKFPVIFDHFSKFFKCGFIVCSYAYKHKKQASIPFTMISGHFRYSKKKQHLKISQDGDLMATFCMININIIQDRLREIMGIIFLLLPWVIMIIIGLVGK